jgi:segregation and condensation protein B
MNIVANPQGNAPEEQPEEIQDVAPEDSPEDSPEDAPEAVIDPQHLKLLEAILFASAEPLSERALAYRLPEDADLKAMLAVLQDHYAARGVNLVRAGKSWAFRTEPELAQQLNKEIDVPRKLSRAAVETLAIIAYHQPVTRAEIEEVRGVGLSKGTLDVLLEADWIKPKGRRRTPGRPMTWGTTDGFLDHFGIEDVRDLPGLDELKATGLLDSGPAISVYGAVAGPGGEAEDTHDDQGTLLELIEGGDDGDQDDDQVEDDIVDGDFDATEDLLDPDDNGDSAA